ncbi:hypothetical protein AB8810_10925 [Xanthomonas sp. NCPPB 3005]|uniref:hypothetical protein n=1 Tax=Xanthomonas sp. NCPPB 3005 TaxID=3240913 RepID=UPI0035116F88
MTDESIIIGVPIAPGGDESKIEWRDLHATPVGLHFAVHPAVSPLRSWTVTHRATGRSVAFAASKLIAMEAAAAFGRTRVNWERASPLAVKGWAPELLATMRRIWEAADGGDIAALRSIP